MADKVEKANTEKVKIEKAKAEKPKAQKPKSSTNFLQRWGMGIRRYFNETIGELRKVKWPTRKEALNLTIIVIIVVAVMATFFWVLDLTFSWLFSLIL